MKKIILILFIALVLRLISINQSLWLDEATTALVAQRSLSDYLHNFAPRDFHPPLYYLIAILTERLLGSSELILRSISVVSAVATVFVTYKVTELFTGSNKAALIAGLFLSTSGLHIYYSQEARMYALATLFTSLSVYYFIKNSWKMFGVSITAMVLTHYVTIFLLPIFFINGYFAKYDKKWWRQFLFSHVYLFVGFLVWLPVFTKQLIGGLGVENSTPLWWNILGKTTPKEIALIPVKFIFGKITIESDLVYALMTGIVGLIFSLMIIQRSPLKVRPLKLNSNDKALVVWLWFLVPLIFTAMIGFWIPVFSYFRILFVLPSLYILLAMGLEALPQKLNRSAVIFVVLVNVIASGVYLFTPRFHREDWRNLVKYVADERGRSDEVLFVNNSQKEAYVYYFDKRALNVEGCILATTSCNNPVPAKDPRDVENGNTIWLMRYVQPIFDPGDKVRNNIENLGYQKTSEHDFNGIVVWRYEK